MDAPFIHLCVHTAYSLCEGALQVPALISQCESMNMPAVAVTDTNNLFGALEFSIKSYEHGIQPIIGCQLNVCYSEEKEHVRVYAKNEDGYYNLMQLVTAAHLEPVNDKFPGISMETLAKFSKEIILLSGGSRGTFNRLLLSQKKDEAVQYVKSMKSLLNDRFYIEIQRHHIPEENEVENDLLNIAYDENVPIVATNNVCYPTPDYYEAHDVLLCIGQGTVTSDDEREKSNPEYYMKSSDEMRKLFSDLPEAYENTSIIAQRCSFLLTPKKPIMPEVHTENGETQDDKLKKMAETGLEARLRAFKDQENYESIREHYYERLNYELDMIKKMGFSGYFLIISDYVQWAKAHNIPVGPGRGSGAGSLVAYSLTITNVDPIKFKLFFERFLNPERVSMPDIDMDFCQSRRDEVINYVQEHYGRESVAQIITFGKLQARAAVKDVGRAMGFPYGMTDRIAKMIPFIPTKPLTLAQAIEQEASLREEMENDYQVKHLMDVALKLEGMCKHTSVHAAGIVITDKIIRDIAPLYKDPKATMPVTQFSMKYVESAGLIKFDFLGLKTLTVIQKAVDLINAHGGDFSIDRIPLDDAKTFNMLRQVDCVGIFQLESGGMKDVIRKLQPDKIEDIIALVALYRPGPMDDIPKYIACKHGIEPITYLDDKLKPILEETYGVMVYQEQVMQIAQVIGGYTLGQADILRRAMGKKQHEEMQKQRVKFVEGAKKNNISESVATKLFDAMSKFASYGFNKSHSTPYGLITYQTAYLKANYPIEFFTSIMTLDMDSTDKLHGYYADLTKRGIKIIPPDINLSCDDFTIDYDKNAVIYSLSALKGSGKHAVQLIEQERKQNGRFESVYDFIDRMSKANVVNRRLLECFIKAGVFDSLHQNRNQLYRNIDILLSVGGDSNQGMLFEKCYPELPDVNDWLVSEKLHGELEAVGFYVSSHPLNEYKELLNKLSVIPISEVDKYDKARIAGVILQVQKKISKNDSRFMIVGISDSGASIDLMVFSDVLNNCMDLLIPGKSLVFDVNVSKNENNTRLTVSSVYELRPGLSLPKMDYSTIDPLTRATNKITVFIDSLDDLKRTKQALSNLYPGDIQVELNIAREKSKIILNDKYKISVTEFLDLQRLLGASKVRHN